MPTEASDCLVIGTGLGAYGSILSALNSGLRITVVDIGERLPENFANSKEQLRRDSNDFERDHPFVKFSSKQAKLSRHDMPRKTLFGSTFFYKELKLAKGHVLPFSEAFGGYSVAWGGAYLPPQAQDLVDFPFDPRHLSESICEVLMQLPHSGDNDGLAPLFADIGENWSQQPLNLSPGQSQLLQMMSKLNRVNSQTKFHVGQSRLLTFSHGGRRCRYCGFCSSGCVYDSIFSSDIAIQELANKERLKLLRGFEVLHFEEVGGSVTVHTRNLQSRRLTQFETQVCFVGAGAVASSSIALRSIKEAPNSVTFLKTGGFVQPFISLRRLGFDWPKQNTQSCVFMDVLDSRFHPHWMHFQVSTPNEIVLDQLGYFKRDFFSRLRRFLIRTMCSHVAVVMVNLHSQPDLIYRLNVEDNHHFPLGDGELLISRAYRKRERKVRNFLFRVMARIGFFPIPFSRKDISHGPGYHVGGSMPMASEPGVFKTDSLGRLKGFKNVHFVDTSVLSSIPGTTIGLLTMANAFRITKQSLELFSSKFSD